MTDIEKLRCFAQAMFAYAGWPDGGDVDGYDLQKIAIFYGLLEAKEITGPCGEECFCAAVGEFPLTCYRKTKLLTGEE